MRSRTELVTTTFEDSEEEFSEDDDSGEDWRPTTSKNGKKSKAGTSGGGSGGTGAGGGGGGAGGAGAKRGRKRKAGAPAGKAASKRRPAYEESDDDDEDEISDEDFDDFDDFETATASGASGSATAQTAPKKTNLPPKKQFTEKSTNATASQATEVVELLVYRRDLLGDFEKNNRLCLWRRDSNNLLQKYIRVKTAPSEFLFTSSSVYSSWDDKRASDFVTVKVKCLDPGNRRVKVINVGELSAMAKEETEKVAKGRAGATAKAVRNAPEVDEELEGEEEHEHEHEHEDEEGDDDEEEDEEGGSYDEQSGETDVDDEEFDEGKVAGKRKLPKSKAPPAKGRKKAEGNAGAAKKADTLSDPEEAEEEYFSDENAEGDEVEEDDDDLDGDGDGDGPDAGANE